MIEPTNARRAAIAAIYDAVAAYPDIPADSLEPYLVSLPGEQRGMAVALQRTVLQRWLTLTFLLNLGAKNPVEKFEAPVQAALLVGAAELVFFGSPAFAVIDETVEACRAMNRLKATGLVNALLRRVTELVEAARATEASADAWVPGASVLPDGKGGVVRLGDAVFPEPSNRVRHLSVATSHPRPLLRKWVETYGDETAVQIAAAGVRVPGVFAVDETNAVKPWEDTMPALAGWLGGHPLRRVQDPASVKAVAATAGLRPRLILDLCAGRGTKTRQLLATHPDARVVAWDPDKGRRADLFKLRESVIASGESPDRLGVWQPREDERYDLILLDVPCSNTGVLGRRPEARYRWNADRLEGLLDLQRQIIERTLGHLDPAGACVLYSTCSVDPEENQQQVRWLCEAAEGRGLGAAETVSESLCLPAGFGENAHDGSYHALVRVGGGKGGA